MTETPTANTSPPRRPHETFICFLIYNIQKYTVCNTCPSLMLRAVTVHRSMVRAMNIKPCPQGYLFIEKYIVSLYTIVPVLCRGLPHTDQGSGQRPDHWSVHYLLLSTTDLSCILRVWVYRWFLFGLALGAFGSALVVVVLRHQAALNRFSPE